MRAVLLSFLVFVISAFAMLPVLGWDLGLNPIFFKMAPLGMMGLAMLSQWSALFDYRKILQLDRAFRQIQSEKSGLSDQLASKDNKLVIIESQLATKESLFQNLSQKVQLLESTNKDHELNLAHANKELAEVRAASQKIQFLFVETEEQLQKANAELAKLKNQSSHLEVISFLSLLQEKGRFIDFMVEDISEYPDQEVGSVARMVHQGCSQVLKDFFEISPLRSDEEGSVVTISEKDNPQEIRVIGKKIEEPIFSAKIVHRGWKTKKIGLPRMTGSQSTVQDRYVISPCEIEVQA